MGNYINTEQFWFDEEYVDKYPLPELKEQQASQREEKNASGYDVMEQCLSDTDTEVAAKRYKSMESYINNDQFWGTELLNQPIYPAEQQKQHINEEKQSNISPSCTVPKEETDLDIDMLSDSDTDTDTDEDSDSDSDATSIIDSDIDSSSDFDSATDIESDADLEDNLSSVYHTDLPYHMYRYKKFMRHKECQLLTWAKSKLVLTQEIIINAYAHHDPNKQRELDDLQIYRRRLIRLACYLENTKNKHNRREPAKPAKLLRKCTELSRVKLSLFKNNGRIMSDIYIE